MIQADETLYCFNDRPKIGLHGSRASCEQQSFVVGCVFLWSTVLQRQAALHLLLFRGKEDAAFVLVGNKCDSRWSPAMPEVKVRTM